jgi:hypothetical protein
MHVAGLRRKASHIDTVRFVRKTLQQLLTGLITYCTVGPVTIDLLAEDTLLEIFEFFTHRLNLQLYCTRRTPARTTPDVWPHFPIVMTSIDHLHPKSGEDNTWRCLSTTIACVKPNSGLLQVRYGEKSCTAMQAPFLIGSQLTCAV